MFAPLNSHSSKANLEGNKIAWRVGDIGLYVIWAVS